MIIYILEFVKILEKLLFGLYPLINKALPTTLTEEKAIAAAAIAGFKSQPVKGYKMPAATGIPMTLNYPARGRAGIFRKSYRLNIPQAKLF